MPLAAVCPANPGRPECQVCTGQHAETSKVNTLGSLSARLLCKTAHFSIFQRVMKEAVKIHASVAVEKLANSHMTL